MSCHGLMRINACTPCHLSHVVQQSVHHEPVYFNLQFMTGILKCVPGEVHLGYVMTHGVVHCTYILHVVMPDGHMFLPLIGR